MFNVEIKIVKCFWGWMLLPKKKVISKSKKSIRPPKQLLVENVSKQLKEHSFKPKGRNQGHKREEKSAKNTNQSSNQQQLDKSADGTVKKRKNKPETTQEDEPVQLKGSKLIVARKLSPISNINGSDDQVQITIGDMDNSYNSYNALGKDLPSRYSQARKKNQVRDQMVAEQISRTKILPLEHDHLLNHSSGIFSSQVSQTFTKIEPAGLPRTKPKKSTKMATKLTSIAASPNETSIDLRKSKEKREQKQSSKRASKPGKISKPKQASKVKKKGNNQNSECHHGGTGDVETILNDVKKP